MPNFDTKFHYFIECRTIRHLKCAPLDVKPYIELLDAEQTGNLSKAFVSEIEELIQSLNSTEDENAKADIANSLAINFEVGFRITSLFTKIF